MPWDRPAYQDLQVAAAGLQLTSSETLTVHYHAHVDVLVYGSAVPVPAELGINVGPNDTAPPHGSAGIAPLHTHDETGVVHIEAPASATFTLGQVFTEWGVELATRQVGNYRTGDAAGDRVQVYVNGHEVTSDPNAIVLHAHDEIAVVVSNSAHPNPSVPSSYSFPAGE